MALRSLRSCRLILPEVPHLSPVIFLRLIEFVRLPRLILCEKKDGSTLHEPALRQSREVPVVARHCPSPYPPCHAGTEVPLGTDEMSDSGRVQTAPLMSPPAHELSVGGGGGVKPHGSSGGGLPFSFAAAGVEIVPFGTAGTHTGGGDTQVGAGQTVFPGPSVVSGGSGPVCVGASRPVCTATERAGNGQTNPTLQLFSGAGGASGSVHEPLMSSHVGSTNSIPPDAQLPPFAARGSMSGPSAPPLLDLPPNSHPIPPSHQAPPLLQTPFLFPPPHGLLGSSAPLLTAANPCSTSAWVGGTTGAGAPLEGHAGGFLSSNGMGMFPRTAAHTACMRGAAGSEVPEPTKVQWYEPSNKYSSLIIPRRVQKWDVMCDSYDNDIFPTGEFAHLPGVSCKLPDIFDHLPDSFWQGEGREPLAHELAEMTWPIPDIGWWENTLSVRKRQPRILINDLYRYLPFLLPFFGFKSVEETFGKWVHPYFETEQESMEEAAQCRAHTREDPNYIYARKTRKPTLFYNSYVREVAAQWLHLRKPQGPEPSRPSCTVSASVSVDPNLNGDMPMPPSDSLKNARESAGMSVGDGPRGVEGLQAHQQQQQQQQQQGGVSPTEGSAEGDGEREKENKPIPIARPYADDLKGSHWIVVKPPRQTRSGVPISYTTSRVTHTSSCDGMRMGFGGESQSRSQVSQGTDDEENRTLDKWGGPSAAVGFPTGSPGGFSSTGYSFTDFPSGSPLTASSRSPPVRPQSEAGGSKRYEVPSDAFGNFPVAVVTDSRSRAIPRRIPTGDSSERLGSAGEGEEGGDEEEEDDDMSSSEEDEEEEEEAEKPVKKERGVVSVSRKSHIGRTFEEQRQVRGKGGKRTRAPSLSPRSAGSSRGRTVKREGGGRGRPSGPKGSPSRSRLGMRGPSVSPSPSRSPALSSSPSGSPQRKALRKELPAAVPKKRGRPPGKASPSGSSILLPLTEGSPSQAPHMFSMLPPSSTFGGPLQSPSSPQSLQTTAFPALIAASPEPNAPHAAQSNKKNTNNMQTSTQAFLDQNPVYAAAISKACGLQTFAPLQTAQTREGQKKKHEGVSGDSTSKSPPQVSPLRLPANANPGDPTQSPPAPLLQFFLNASGGTNSSPRGSPSFQAFPLPALSSQAGGQFPLSPIFPQPGSPPAASASACSSSSPTGKKRQEREATNLMREFINHHNVWQPPKDGVQLPDGMLCVLCNRGSLVITTSYGTPACRSCKENWIKLWNAATEKHRMKEAKWQEFIQTFVISHSIRHRGVVPSGWESLTPTEMWKLAKENDWLTARPEKKGMRGRGGAEKEKEREEEDATRTSERSPRTGFSMGERDERRGRKRPTEIITQEDLEMAQAAEAAASCEFTTRSGRKATALAKIVHEAELFRERGGKRDRGGAVGKKVKKSPPQPTRQPPKPPTELPSPTGTGEKRGRGRPRKYPLEGGGETQKEDKEGPEGAGGATTLPAPAAAAGAHEVSSPVTSPAVRRKGEGGETRKSPSLPTRRSAIAAVADSAVSFNSRSLSSFVSSSSSSVSILSHGGRGETDKALASACVSGRTCEPSVITQQEDKGGRNDDMKRRSDAAEARDELEAEDLDM
uniref:Uncharacterized protein n=1 Tax=Chromera velia CCMP2878 TaxID=1169474 RepID=A0A0G4H2S3_9ALVE|eukprot:Cvel_5590.t1-p1 / transcript=Cvel_5590.t1 / gene=Cvel_5590 / organism=Chromera_velia_CCMP2878 / gene_product=hypothetical protein / transcript_product=hypothetical protein / location=Cvel_scaffold263:41449-47925(+) / protein_length=1593 / sequence_SO=supercontig / SO=protein_coding / is_pseudo=false